MTQSENTQKDHLEKFLTDHPDIDIAEKDKLVQAYENLVSLRDEANPKNIEQLLTLFGDDEFKSLLEINNPQTLSDYEMTLKPLFIRLDKHNRISFIETVINKEIQIKNRRNSAELSRSEYFNKVYELRKTNDRLTFPQIYDLICAYEKQNGYSQKYSNFKSFEREKNRYDKKKKAR